MGRGGKGEVEDERGLPASGERDRKRAREMDRRWMGVGGAGRGSLENFLFYIFLKQYVEAFCSV